MQPVSYGRGAPRDQRGPKPRQRLRAGRSVWALCGCTALAVLGGIALCGCAPATIDLIYDPAPSGEIPQVFDDRAWATVLRENVKQELVDYGHLHEHSEPLEQYLRLIARVGPTCTPQLFKSPQDRLVYYINAYNAGVLRAVLVENIPTTMYPTGRPSLDHRYRIRADGRLLTLHQLRAAAREAADGDPRVEFALCGAARGCPPLDDQPYRSPTLPRRLEELARETMGRSSMIQIDHQRQRLLLGHVIASRGESFVAHCARITNSAAPTLLSALLQMADGARRDWLNTAVGYREGGIPFDRTLNQWELK